MTDEPKNFAEFAEQYRPQRGTQRSWGAYFTALASGGIIDGAYALKDALTPKSPPKPLYIPDDDAPLYKLAQDTIDALRLPEPETFGRLFGRECMERLKFATYPNVFIKLIDMAEDTYISSRPYLPSMLPPELSKSIEGARWRDRIRETIRFAQDFNLFVVITTCCEITYAFMAGLPQLARVEWAEFDKLIQNDDPPQGLQVELTDLISDMPEVVEYMIYPFYKAEHMKSTLYRTIRNTLDNNVCLASGLPFTEENRYSAKLVMPTKYKGEDVVITYLRDSPLLQVFA